MAGDWQVTAETRARMRAARQRVVAAMSDAERAAMASRCHGHEVRMRAAARKRAPLDAFVCEQVSAIGAMRDARLPWLVIAERLGMDLRTLNKRRGLLAAAGVR